ncbi:MAG: heavy-metal-associated domain-containing protein [Planctomycetota bacterium]
MKPVFYLVAVVAAVGIAAGIASTGTDNQPNQTTVANGEVTPVGASEQTTLLVPDMHCQFACFPKVKENLEADGNVALVELAEQPDDGSFNPQVIINHGENFDLEAAIASLTDAGYADSEAVQ